MRKAISLIELVLAIIVIAISVMSVPMMLQQSAKSDNFSMVQEAILAARTKMGNILSFRWDRNSLDTNNTNGRFRALDVISGAAALDRNNTYYEERRIGHVYGDLRRKMFAVETNVSALVIAPNDTNFTNINDFDAKSATIDWKGANSATDRYEYLDRELNLTTRVFYIADNTVDYNATNINFVFDTTSAKTIKNINNSTNIKMIELNVTSQNYLPFVFRTFSCNLGESRLLSRPLP